MKKLFSILLAVAMLCTMSISAFAATVDTTDSTTSANLTVKYASKSNKDAYAATIEWGSMEFTYTSASQKWNTDKMIWEENTTAGWSKANTDKAGQVKVLNKSSQAITVKFSYNDDTTNSNDIDGITVNDTAIVEAGYKVDAATAGTNGANGTAGESTFSILPTGTYTGTNTDAVKVGTITITLE